MKKQKKWIAAALLATALAGSGWQAAADDLEDRLAEIRSQIASAQAEQASAMEIITRVKNLLVGIQAELDAANAELARIRNEQAILADKIAKNQAELEEAIAALHRRQAILARRVRAIYMYGQLNYLEVIMGSKSFSDFANRLELLKRIIRADFNLILEIRQRQAEIEAKRAELEAQKKEVDALEAEAAKTQQAIDEKRAEQQAVLDEASQQKEAAEQMERDLQADSQDIQRRIQQRAAGGGGVQIVGTGQLSWPVSGGVITSPQGWRVHPIFGTSIYHAGMDIGVDEGTPVHAADDGVVVDADWLGGYGNCVIIDHGNGMQTVYGHNSALVVSAGQRVSKGELIAYAGSTGYSTGPHCHFEVRINGEPVDPMGYL